MGFCVLNKPLSQQSESARDLDLSPWTVHVIFYGCPVKFIMTGHGSISDLVI